MATPLTDSHCHLNFAPLHDQLPQVLQHAREQDVGYLLCVSVNMEHLDEVLAIARSHPNIFASVGVHPDEQAGREPSVDELVNLAQSDKVVAIGETGLDYFRSKGDMTWQQERFRRHIRAARASRKPIIVHTRDAAADTLRILREEDAESAGGVMHCFTESWETAKAALDLGFYISFSGIVTFANAAKLREVAQQVPADRLLIETDSPYLAPVPKRGRPNEPAYLRHTAQFLAAQRSISLENLAEITTNNFFRLFRDAGRKN